MSEWEIRQIIAAVCAELDQQVRTAVTRGIRRVVVPAAVGAGLALSTISCAAELYGVPADGLQRAEVGIEDQGVDKGPALLYGVPDGMAPTDAADDAATTDGGSADDAAGKDKGPAPLYAAPLYAAPM